MDLRPDWTQPKYDSLGKIDLSVNVCHDVKLPKFEFDYSMYSETSKCYNILSDYHGVYARQIAIGLGLSELFMRIAAVIKENEWSMRVVGSPTWSVPAMTQKLYGIPHGDDVVYIANPSGNTGEYVDTEEWNDKCKLLIVDEAYADFTDMPKTKFNTKTMILKTMSKSLSLPGIRFGWAIGYEPIIAQIQNMRPAQVCIGGVEDQLINMLDEIPHHVNRMNQTKKYLEKNYNCIPSHGNYILIKNSDKLQKFFKMKELNDGVMRMALINRQFVTKNALDKDHPFFNRTQPD